MMKKLGKLKAMYGRSAMYVGLVNFLMLIYLTLRDPAIEPWMMAAGLAGLVFVVLLDVKYVMRFEQEYIMDMTPNVRRIEEKVDRILDREGRL